MLMPLLFLLVTATVKDVRQMKFIVLLMCLAVFVMDKSFWDAVKDRDFSSFSRDLQEGGSMGYAGVQGLAAFNAQYTWFLVALAGALQKRLLKLACLGLAVFAATCVMYSFSRGGYVALLAGWVFVGIAKYRKLLVILMLFAVSWASLVPNAVRDRVLMTYDPNDGSIDHSAAVRVELWNDAIDLFQSNPLLGTGYGTYAFMKRLYNYADTHNIYLKALVETGVIGFALLLGLLGRSLYLGCRLFRRARDPFFSALGLGLAAWIVCTATANLFGDRWTYFQINGYLWLLAGLIARGFMIESRGEATKPSPEKSLMPLKPEVVSLAT
jgi:O-antigen ligase